MRLRLRVSTLRLSDFKVFTFDCYGTLIDWETGILGALSPLVERSGLPLSPGEILASFARHESVEEAETPQLLYRELLGRVYRRLARDWNVASGEEEAHAFGLSVGDWPPFADSRPALQYLQGFFKLVVLSNIDRASFERSRQRLGITFNAVFTAEEIGSYKPDLRNFRFMLDALAKEGIAKNEILHVAQSLFHDHAPANRLGLASAWIDRRQGKDGLGATPPPPPGVRTDFRFESLAELVAAHRAERGL